MTIAMDNSATTWIFTRMLSVTLLTVWAAYHAHFEFLLDVNLDTSHCT